MGYSYDCFGYYVWKLIFLVYVGRICVIKAAQSVTFDLLILKIMFLFFKNTVKILKFR